MTAKAPSSSTTSRSERAMLLVVPPFQGVACPALGVSQMKANLVHHGFDCRVLYLNFVFADRIGGPVYDWMTGSGPALVGDMIFARAANDVPEAALARYVDEILTGTDVERQFAHWLPGEAPLAALQRLSRTAVDFIQGSAIDAILAHDPWLVGVSSTFQSNCASLALVREIKRRRPDIITVLGGANCEMEMGEELLRNYPIIDYVGRGECDKTIVQLARTLAAGEPVHGLTGFLSRDDDGVTPQSPPLHGADLDALPYPDFTDYFEQLEALPLRNGVEPGLIAETSRGCWWGAKQHCTFCAFNREGMVFRSKKPDRAMREIRALVERYGMRRIEMADNILDMNYFKSVVPELQEERKIEFFWETKANLSRDQVRQLAAAGVKWIQPGIESLSDRTLELMRKGSTQLQNAQLLKWCTESGVRITWNWLFGFPGEDETELDDLERAAKALHHLQPPGASPVLYLERFAPYQATPEQWGLEPIRPARAYFHVYPQQSAESLGRMAFFLECDALREKERGAAHRQLLRIVGEWTRNWRASHLIAAPEGDALTLYDTRRCAKQFRRRLRGVERDIYLHCWKVRGERDIKRLFADRASPERVAAILRGFVDDYLMLERNGRFLSLATDPRHGYRTFPQNFPGGQVLDTTQPERKARRSTATRLINLLLGRTPLREALQRRIVAAVIRKHRPQPGSRAPEFEAPLPPQAESPQRTEHAA